MLLSQRNILRYLLNLTMIAVSNASITKEKVDRETSETNLLDGAPIRKTLRGPRNLFQTEAFDVPLFLELQFLNVTIVEQLELYHEESEPVRQLCSCVEEQVRKCLLGIVSANITFPD
jgi:hypothetical protein